MQKFPCCPRQGCVEKLANLAPDLARSLRNDWVTKMRENQAGQVAGWLDGVRAGLLVCWLAACKENNADLAPENV